MAGEVPCSMHEARRAATAMVPSSTGKRWIDEDTLTSRIWGDFEGAAPPRRAHDVMIRTRNVRIRVPAIFIPNAEPADVAPKFVVKWFQRRLIEAHQSGARLLAAQPATGMVRGVIHNFCGGFSTSAHCDTGLYRPVRVQESRGKRQSPAERAPMPAGACALAPEARDTSRAEGAT